MPKQWEQRGGKRFLAEQEEIILRVGENVFSKKDMIELLKCANFRAARNLNMVLYRFDPKSVRELARRITINNLLDIPGLGQASIWVWFKLMDSVGIDVEVWLNGSHLKIPSMLALRNKTKKEVIRKVA